MKKIVRQQNYLKGLIDNQNNPFLTRHSLQCLVRSMIEPLLDESMEGVVLYRIENTDNLQGLIKRLEYSNLEVISYADNSGNLVEKVWANTEFLCAMTSRYVAILVWDNNTNNKETVRYYSVYNSNLQDEVLDIIRRNSKVNISKYKEKYRPERRDNKTLNSVIRKLLDSLDDATNDAVLGYAEKNADTLSNVDYFKQKSRMISHEIKNQLSICDLYSEIIKKQCETGNINGIFNALTSIDKSIKMTNNLLLSLKEDNLNPTMVSLKQLIENSVNLSRVYSDDKNIELKIENNIDAQIFVDTEKMEAVIINLVKNAVEAFVKKETENNLSNDKYIKIETEEFDDIVNIVISNNAPGIKEPEKIFTEGYTTKTNGSGLGLVICKKSVEEQQGKLVLSRSSNDFTEFTISLGLAK